MRESAAAGTQSAHQSVVSTTLVHRADTLAAPILSARPVTLAPSSVSNVMPWSTGAGRMVTVQGSPECSPMPRKVSARRRVHCSWAPHLPPPSSVPNRDDDSRRPCGCPPTRSHGTRHMTPQRRPAIMMLASMPACTASRSRCLSLSALTLPVSAAKHSWRTLSVSGQSQHSIVIIGPGTGRTSPPRWNGDGRVASAGAARTQALSWSFE